MPELRRIVCAPEDSLGDFRRFPGCRLILDCAMCGWSKTYDPERIIDRLRALKSGGHTTRIVQVAARVAWPCPACGRLKWRTQLAYPSTLTETEARRLANRYRN